MTYSFRLHTVVWGAFLLAFFGVAHAQTVPVEPQGISFYVLRVIYPESDKKGVSLTAYNSNSVPYLMQSWIRPVDPLTGNVDMAAAGHPAMPFIVTPPLARLEADGELTLRIRRNAEPLPADRESVFFITMKAIPAQATPGDGVQAGKMALTVVSNLKVFYRPAGLVKRAVEDMSPQLRFRREGTQLVVDNPTPYWLTFSRLTVGAAALDQTQLRQMVPPKGQRRYALPAETATTVTWKLIDEDGWDTPAEHASL